MSRDIDRAPYRVDLTKQLATYYVIADDEGGNSGRLDWMPERDVLDVQRAADLDAERALQHEDLTHFCFTSQSPLKFLTYEAVSHGQAAYFARRKYADQQRFEALEDVFYVDELAFTGAGFTGSDD